MMIIECPVCATKYNVALPPEGRTVRCRKCAHMWRALPGQPVEDGVEAEKPISAFSGREEVQDSSQDYRYQGGDTYAAPEKGVNPAGEDSLPASETVSYSDGFQTDGDQSDRVADGDYVRSTKLKEQPDEQDLLQESQEPYTSSNGSAGAKVRWFGGFRRRGDQARSPSVGLTDRDMERNIEPIPFPRAHLEDALADSPVEEVRTLEEARAAVRSVFSSLSETRPAIPGGRSYVSPVLGQTAGVEHPPARDAEISSSLASRATAGFGFSEKLFDELQGEDARDSDKPGAVSHEDLAAAGSRSAVEGPAAPFPERVFASSGTSDDEEGPDPDADLHYPFRRRTSAENGQALNPENASDDSDARLAQHLETQLRHKPADDTNTAGAFLHASPSVLRHRPALPLEQLTEKESAFPSQQDRDGFFEDGGEARPEFDDRLFRDIEETRDFEPVPARTRRQGGLVLVAAWGLFLCTAAGLFAGFVAFRDAVSFALPGLAPLYRGLNLPVTVQPIMFEDIQYTWTLQGSNPALVITGVIVNKARRKVKIPPSFITIKDENPELDREYSVSFLAGTTKIRAQDRADFRIELVSPSPTVTAVELELRHVN